MKYTTRLGVVFTLFVSLFSILVLRLWFVQIAEGAEAVSAVERQSDLVISSPAPRGDIYDAKGVLLASSRFVPAIWVDRHFVKPAQKDQLIQSLSALLNQPADDIAALYDAAGQNGRFQVAVIDTVKAYQLAEQLREYPGVTVERMPERVYLMGESLAHVIGHLGKPTASDIEENPDLDPNTRIGKLGVERVYEDLLAGVPGETVYRLDSGEITQVVRSSSPVPGDQVFLTIDSGLQGVVEEALSAGIDNANQIKAEQRARGVTEGVRHDVVRGAAVVLDVRTGAVLAMASHPSFDPGLFVGGLDKSTFDDLQQRNAFLNLAVGGLYPPASTFKAVTYMALLEHNIPFPADTEGVDAPNRIVHCDGALQLQNLTDGSQQVFRDWYGNRDLGWLNYHDALSNSCNLFFYAVALGVWQNWRGQPLENVIQDEARSLGFGERSGIDLTGEAPGVVPDRQLYESWKEQMLADESAPKLLTEDRLAAASPWYGGDLMNLAIGQGGLLATPLQVANAYASIANGGTVYQPHVVARAVGVDGTLAYVASPKVVSKVDLDPADVSQLLTDLNRVVTVGTARAAFEGFGPSLARVGGKTGTGQSVKSKDNHAWFAGIAPIDDPRYAVAVLLDEGGSGGAAAAPIARYILQYLMGEELDPIRAGQLAD